MHSLTNTAALTSRSHRTLKAKDANSVIKKTVIEVIRIEDPYDVVVSNINDFVEWARSLGILRGTCKLDDIEFYANYFLAYNTYLNTTNRYDDLNIRREWFANNRTRIIEHKLAKAGML